MIEILKKGLANCKADYADLRYEVDRIVRINIRGKEIQSISDSIKDGFHLRLLVNGGFATNTFNDKKLVKRAIRTTRKAALLGSKYVGKKIEYKHGPVIKDNVLTTPREDPRNKKIEEKLDLLKHYNQLVLKVKQIQSTNLTYSEWVKKKYLINSLGSEIEQEQIICFISGELIARDGNNIQNVRVAIGGCDDFGKMRNREIAWEEKAKIAVDLLRADPVKGSVHKVLLNPNMVGVFIHEAFGHFSEADLVVDNPGLLSKLKLVDQDWQRHPFGE